jgi:hypothetical protein
MHDADKVGPHEDQATGKGVMEAVDRHMKVLNLHKTSRYRVLRHHMSFYQGSQHDHLARRWDGGYRDPGVGYLHERLRPQGFVPVQSIPYGIRKPDTGIPLARQITNRFTEILLGQGRQPAIYVPADLKTARYLSAVFREALMWDVLTEARDIAGSCGSAAIVPAVIDGVPTAEVLHPSDLHVMEWKDAAGWVPEAVVEQRLIDKLVPDDDGKLETRKFWRTRKWDETHSTIYKDVPEKHDGIIPVDDEVEHHAGRCPVIWHQNTRSTKSPDGMPDCDGVWHLLDQLDRLVSQTTRASRANADPTLHIKESERYARRGKTVKKGSVITTSSEGDAKYLEIAGTSIRTGMDLIEIIKQEILQTAECIVVDPTTAGSYKSGEALQLLWRSMEAKANRLRVTIESSMKTLCRVWISMGKELGVANLEDENPGEGILLPPYIHQPDTPELPDEMDENDAEIEPQEVGTGAHVVFRWPPYWSPTPKQINDLGLAMQAARTSGVLSTESRIGIMANYVGLDPQEEEQRIRLEMLELAKKEEEEFDRHLEQEEARLKQEVNIQGRADSPRAFKSGEGGSATSGMRKSRAEKLGGGGDKKCDHGRIPGTNQPCKED